MQSKFTPIDILNSNRSNEIMCVLKILIINRSFHLCMFSFWLCLTAKLAIRLHNRWLLQGFIFIRRNRISTFLSYIPEKININKQTLIIHGNTNPKVTWNTEVLKNTIIFQSQSLSKTPGMG